MRNAHFQCTSDEREVGHSAAPADAHPAKAEAEKLAKVGPVARQHCKGRSA
jgi:hypothetical protein